MTSKKGLWCLIGGMAAIEYAAYHTGSRGVTEYIRDLATSTNLGEFVDTAVSFLWDDYGQYAMRDMHSAIGVAGQGCMYGGLGRLIADLIEKKKGTSEDKK